SSGPRQAGLRVGLERKRRVQYELHRGHGWCAAHHRDHTRQQVGYPINGWWQRPYTFKDLDGNGIITANEITVADSAVFVGYANPRWEVTYTTGFDLLNKRLRIVGLFDHKSGFYQLNGTDRIRCQSRNNCRGLVDPTSPLWGQARGVALREQPSGT